MPFEHLKYLIHYSFPFDISNGKKRERYSSICEIYIFFVSIYGANTVVDILSNAHRLTSFQR